MNYSIAIKTSPKTKKVIGVAKSFAEALMVGKTYEMNGWKVRIALVSKTKEHIVYAN